MEETGNYCTIHAWNLEILIIREQPVTQTTQFRRLTMVTYN